MSGLAQGLEGQGLDPVVEDTEGGDQALDLVIVEAVRGAEDQVFTFLHFVYCFTCVSGDFRDVRGC